MPVVGVLNLMDEAHRYGVRLDLSALSERLNIPLYAISAKQGTGCSRATEGIRRLTLAENQTQRVENLGAALATQTIHQERIDALLRGAVQMPSINARTFTNTLDGVLLHSLWGIPLFFASMFGVFWLIWNLGLPSADPVDAVTGWIQSQIL